MIYAGDGIHREKKKKSLLDCQKKKKKKNNILPWALMVLLLSFIIHYLNYRGALMLN